VSHLSLHEGSRYLQGLLGWLLEGLLLLLLLA
jgi:hypothetical protein